MCWKIAFSPNGLCTQKHWVARRNRQTSLSQTSLSPLITVYPISYLSPLCCYSDVISQNRKKCTLFPRRASNSAYHSVLKLDINPVCKGTLRKYRLILWEETVCPKYTACLTPVKSLLLLYGTIFPMDWSRSVVPELFLIKDTHIDQCI